MLRIIPDNNAAASAAIPEHMSPLKSHNRHRPSRIHGVWIDIHAPKTPNNAASKAPIIDISALRPNGATIPSEKKKYATTDTINAITNQTAVRTQNHSRASS